MALSFVSYTGDGTNRNFAVPFGYISKTDVSVLVNGVAVSVAWISSSIVQTATAPTAGASVIVKRTTPKNASLVNFEDASTLTESDLDTSNSQLLYIVQEAADRADNALSINPSTGQYDAATKRLSNLATPVNPSDAVTKDWAETGMSSALAQAQAAAAAASASASEAAVVATVAALRALTPNFKSAVIVKGVTSALDGKGATYFWDATSTEADDGELIVAPTAGGTGRWKQDGYKLGVTNSVRRSYSGKFTDRIDLRDWGVRSDSNSYTIEIQRALSECPSGVTLWGPGKDAPINITANGSQCLFLSQNVSLREMNLVPVPGVGSTIDTLVISPVNGDWHNFSMADIVIGSKSAGRTGRHGIRILCDNTTKTITSAVFERLFVVNGGASQGYAFVHDNTGDTMGGMVGSIIRDCWLGGGLLFSNTGDRNNVINNQLNNNTGVGGMVDVSFVSGAMNFHFLQNNCTAVSVIFRNGLNPHVKLNTFEQTIAAYQPNDAVLDFAGGTTQTIGSGGTSQILAPVCEDNVFQLLHTSAPHCVRFDQTSGAKLKAGNHFNIPIVKTPVVVTSNAANPFISRNQNVNASGAPLVSGSDKVTRHEKPVSHVLLSNQDYTISSNTDHTISIASLSGSDKTIKLPNVSECFPGEQFVIEDVGSVLGGTYKYIIQRADGSSDFIYNGTTSFNMTTGGMRVILTAVPGFSIWHLNHTTL